MPAPTETANNGLTLAEGATATITAALLDYDDAEQSDAQITYTITSVPIVGTVRLNGVALGVGGTFTQADLNANLVSYAHDGSETTGASFGFSVSDGAGGEVTGQSFAITVTAVDDAPDLDTSITEATYVENAAGFVIDANLTLTDPDGPNMTGAVVAIASGYVDGQDSLSFTAMHGITGSFNTATGQLVLSGSATAAQYQAVLRTVTYANSNNAPSTTDRVIEFSATSSLYNSANGHFYQFVSAPNTSWTAAQTAAAASSLFGLQGYLSTITSAGEQAFVQSRLQGTGWLGANDATTEGDWRWVTGPEGLANGGTGTPFWLGNGGGAPVGGAYSNWAAGEPNNFGAGEDYGHFYDEGPWNDFANNDSVLGYVVEFGGMPGDPAIDLTGSVTIHVQVANDAPTLDPGASPTLGAVDEDAPAPTGAVGTLVSALVDFTGGGGLDNVTDADSGAVTGIAVTGVNSGAGTLYYSLDGGANWQAASGLSDSNALLLAADADTRVYFRGGANVNGAFGNALTIRAWDRSAGGAEGSLADTSTNGGTSAFSSATDSVSATINAIDDAPDLDTSVAERTFIENAAGFVVDANLMLTDPDGPDMTGAVVAIASGYVNGQDSLGFTAMHGITGSFNAATGQLVLSGSATAAQYQAVLRTVTYSNNSDAPNTGDRQIEFTATSASSLYYSGTGHFYQYVSAPVISWTAAQAAAAASTLFGMQGYLATVTSAAENVFVISKLAGNAWLGGSDAAVEGQWTWVTGPEAGQIFYNGIHPSGTTPAGAFSFWQSGEPNNAGNEDYLQYFLNGWNDLIEAGAPNYIDGYLIEYGGMPGDPAIDLTGSVTIHVQVANDAPTLDPGASPTLGALDEDASAPTGAVGTLVSALVDFTGGGGLDNVTDADSGAVTGIAVTGVNSGAGTLYYSLDGGANWQAASGLSDSNALLLAADADTRVYFRGGANVNGAFGNALTIRAWDRSAGGAEGSLADTSTNGGTSAFSSATDSVSATINAIDDAPDLDTSITEATYTENASSLVVDANLTLIDVDSPNLGGAVVAIGGGYVNGQDSLGFDAALAASYGVTGTFTAATGQLVFSGTTTVANYQALLRTVTYSNNSDAPSTGDRQIEFTANPASSLYYSANGHFYQFVTSADIQWTPAQAAAAGSSLFGLQGYLATVTSAGEQAFIQSRLQGFGWMGASDAAGEGDWRWVTGPEGLANGGTGTPFWSGGPAGASVGGAYENWDGGEPNNGLGQEHFGHFLNDGQWNDFRDNPGAGLIAGYVVEYGGMPGDAAIDLTGSVTIHVQAVNDAPVATAGQTALAAISEDNGNPAGQTVSSLFGGLFSDVDAGSSLAGVAISANPATASQGSWQYHDGSTWVTIGAVSEGSALLLAPATLVRFVPAFNFTGPAPSLSAYLVDNSFGGVTAGATTDVSVNGGTTAFSDNSVLVQQQVDSAFTATARGYFTSGPSLINGLGGGSGFGETNFGRNDDFQFTIDLRPVFGASGANLFGDNVTHITLSTNGWIGWYSASNNNYVYVGVHNFDVDTRGTTAPVTPGGTSTGSNLLWVDEDAGNNVVTITWDDVGQYNQNTSNPEAFQLQLIGSASDRAVILFRYENTDFAGYYGGPFISRSAGFAAGYPYHYALPTDQGLELVAPNVSAAQLDSTVGNTGAVGVWAVPTYAGVASANQPPVATTPNDQRNGSVIEAGNLDDGSAAPGQPNAAGQLSATDGDGGTISWSASTLDGRYGTFTLTPAGAWTYALDNSRAEVDGLAEGETGTDTLAVLISDGQGGFGGDTVTITINGANDAPVVTTAPGNDAGAVAEAGLAPDGSDFVGTTNANGQLASTDVDNGATATWSATTLQGTYGTFTLSAAGAWTYTLDNARAATNGLAAGQQVTDVLNATVIDDKGAVATETVTITVTGTNDRPDAVDDDLLFGGAALDVAVVTGRINDGQAARDGLVSLGRFASVTVITDTAGPSLGGYEAVVTFSNDPYADPAGLGNIFADYVDAGGRLALATYALTTTWGIQGRITTAGYMPLLPTAPGSSPSGAIVAVQPNHAVFANVDLAALTGTFFYNSNYTNSPLAAGATLLATDGNGLNMIAVNAAGTVYAANIFPGFEGAGETDFWTLFANMLAPPPPTEDGVTSILASKLLENDTDPDAGDTLTVTAVSATSALGASVTLNGATISYDPRAALNHLAAGAVVQDSFTYTISDSHGATDSAVVRFNVVGVNDAPVLANAGTVAGAVFESGYDANGAFRASPPLVGKLFATDVDDGAVLTWSIVGGGDTPLGGVVIDQTGTWTYSLDIGASDYLALGQIATETFTVRVTDEQGGYDEQQVEITITGSNDRPVIVNGSTASAVIGEAGDGSAQENVVVHGANGTLIFTDVDLTDTHGASFTALGANYLGSFSLGPVNDASDNVGWSFSVSDAALDGLVSGQTLVQSYLITITDSNGGTAIQPVTLYLVGSNDAAILSADNVFVVQGPTPVTASGDLSIDDVDGPEAFQVQNGTAGTHGSFSVDAEGRWSYQAFDNNADLQPGQSLIDVFIVKAADGTPTSVTVTIAGSNDSANARPDRFETDEATPIGPGLNLFADNGFGPDVDPDGSLAVAKINGVALVPGQPIQLPSGALLTVNADGTFRYDPNDAFNAFNQIPGAANQFGYDQFSYQLSDGSGASVLIRVNGLASPDDIILGQAIRNEFVNNTIFGTPGNDRFMLQPGGTDSAFGLGGNDGFYFGSALRAHHAVDGGAGTDTLALQGNYAGLVLGAGIVNTEVLLVLSGSDTRFGDLAGNSYDYSLKTVDANVGAGAVLTVQAGGLKPGEDLVFDGSAETNGAFRIFAGRGVDQLTGGAGNDGFFFGAEGNLTGADRIVGGAGIDSVALRGNYTGAGAVVFQDASLSGIEVIVLLSGHTNEFGGAIVPGGYDYDLTLANGNVAAGQRLDVIATNLWADESARVDGRAVGGGTLRILSGGGDDILLGGAGADIIAGGLGADQIDGGAGADLYLYRSALESTAAARDTIAFTTGDRIDLSMIDAKAGTAANDGFSFVGNAAFTGVAGELRAVQQGGQWIVEGDVNGDGVADLVIAVTGAAPLAAGDFVL